MSNQQNKSVKTFVRTSRPQTLAATIGGLMQVFGIRASDSDLAERWDTIMGSDIASIAKLAAVKKNRDKRYDIVIRPIAPAFALQLSYQKNEITEKLNHYFGHDAIGKITFRK